MVLEVSFGGIVLQEGSVVGNGKELDSSYDPLGLRPYHVLRLGR